MNREKLRRAVSAAMFASEGDRKLAARVLGMPTAALDLLLEEDPTSSDPADEPAWGENSADGDGVAQSSRKSR